MRLIQTLRGLQSAARRQTVTAVAFFLQRSQRMQWRYRAIRFGNFFLYGSALAQTSGRNLFGGGFIPHLFGIFSGANRSILAIVVMTVGGELPLQTPEQNRHVRQDFQLTVHHQGQGRCLHPTCRPHAFFAASFQAARDRARGVNANQPIGFRTTISRSAESLKILARPQFLKSLADGGLGHGLQPQAFDRFAASHILFDLAENQLAFASSITSIDEAIHIFACGQFFQQTQLSGLTTPRTPLEGAWQHRQVCQRPVFQLWIVILGLAQLQQVTNRPGNQVVWTFPVAIELFEGTWQRARQIGSDAGFLSDDELHFFLALALSGLPGDFKTKLFAPKEGRALHWLRR